LTQIPSLIRREAGTSQPAGRKDRRQLSASHLLVGVAVVLAFVLNILALQDRSASVLVAIADEDISTGDVFDPGMVRLAPLTAEFEGLSSLLTEDDLTAHEGWVVRRSIHEGGVVELSALSPPAAGQGQRSMSIPIDITRAAGGTVVAGDRVDVIAVRDGVAAFVIADAEVLAVPIDTDRSLAASEHYLVVAVDAAEALALAEAMAEGSVDVIRSTGAPLPDVESNLGP
jgi:Flp pilus assembly protein CpaB